jgi:hypothetical protein
MRQASIAKATSGTHKMSGRKKTTPTANQNTCSTPEPESL